MADEITFTRSATIVSGDYRDQVASEVVSFDLGAVEKYENNVPVTTAETDLAFTNVTTPRFCVLKNLSSTQIIQWGPKSAGAMVEVGRLDTLEEAIFRIGSVVTLRVRTVAGTATLRVRVWG